MDKLSSQSSSGLFQSLYDGMFKGDFSDNNSKTKIASQVGIGVTPILGQIADARDTFAAASNVGSGKTGAWRDLAFSLVGWVPLAGDFIKSANKFGTKHTFSAIGDAFLSVKNTWKQLTSNAEEKLGSVGTFFYKPATDMNKKGLDYGTLGETNRWGDISVAKNLDDKTKQTTFDHENVHRFFSPTFKYGQELRANLRFLGYMESHLLRRVEEGWAEAWSKFKSEGLSGVREGWRFPIDYDYGINPDRLKVEKNILLGIGSTAIGAGAAIGDSVKSNE